MVWGVGYHSARKELAEDLKILMSNKDNTPPYTFSKKQWEFQDDLFKAQLWGAAARVSGFKQFYLEICYFLFTFQKHSLHGIFKNSYTFLHFLRVCRNAVAQCGASDWNSVFRLTYLNVVKERTRFKTKTRGNNNFHQSMASVGKKRQKSTNGDTTLDKRSIVELIKVVFKEECLKQQPNVSKVIRNNLTLRNKKLESLEKRFEKKYRVYWKCSQK